MRQIRKIVRDKRGEGYIDVAVMVLCVMLVIALRTHVIQHRGASYCRTVRIGYQHQDQHHEQCVCSPDRHQYDQNGREGSGSIRWCYDRVEIRKSV